MKSTVQNTMWFRPIIALLFIVAPHLWSAEMPPIAVDFESFEAGALRKQVLEKHFGPIAWETLEDRAVIKHEEQGRVLEVTYPKGKVGSSESGAQFVLDLEPGRYATLSYRFRFAPRFPFVKGGKLPGLSSGGSQFTGGRPPGSKGGWSVRYMWRREGALELYFYHPEMKGKYGERHSLGVTLKPGEWYSITQRIDAGEPGKRNGRIEVEVNDKIQLQLKGLSLYGSQYGLVDSFLFSTFFGGGDSSWAPEADCTIQFDDFRISPEQPSFSGD